MERDDEEAIEPPRRRRGQRRVVRWLGRALLALAFIALGVAAGVWRERRASTRGASGPGAMSSGVGAASPGSTGTPASALAADPSGDVEVMLTPEGVARAGIKTTTLTQGEPSASLRVPSSVMPNAYREVKVTPVAGGIVRKVDVALGDHVRRGMPVVTLFSTELAEAQTKYLTMVAMFEADHKKLDRTEQLV